MYRWQIAHTIHDVRVIAIIRTGTAAEAVDVGRALLAAGMRAVEVSLTVPRGLDAVAELSATLAEGAVIGAGTVLDGATARAAILAGATFLVSPTIQPDVIATAARYGCAALPGASTATEAVRAMELGADFVKLFPADGGIGTMSALRSALPQIPFVPTGGIEPADVSTWLSAGAAAVGLGGALTRGSPDEISRRAADLMDGFGPRA